MGGGSVQRPSTLKESPSNPRCQAFLRAYSLFSSFQVAPTHYYIVSDKSCGGGRCLCARRPFQGRCPHRHCPPLGRLVRCARSHDPGLSSHFVAGDPSRVVSYCMLALFWSVSYRQFAIVLGDPSRVDALIAIARPWVDSFAALARMTQGFLCSCASFF